jgi:hypothetical protein
MPGVAMHVLNTNQPLFGVDVHKNLPPPLLPFLPHLVVWGVGLSQAGNFLWSAANTSKASSPESHVARPVRADSGYTIGRTHDAGPHPGHLMANLLLPVIMLGSASKHEFGSGTVKVPGGVDMAVGVAYVLNANLDCADFPCPPTPSSMSICGMSTVYAGFSVGDLLRGVVQMWADMVVSWLISGACTVAGNMIGGSNARTALNQAFQMQSGRLRDIFHLYTDAQMWNAARPAIAPRSWLLSHLIGSPVGNSGVPVPNVSARDEHGHHSNVGGGGLWSGTPSRSGSPGARMDRAIDGLFR